MPKTSFKLIGDISENGTSVVQGTLEIYVTEYEITLREHVDGMFRGKTLCIHPFSARMFLGEGVIKNGYQISMDGNGLGSYTNGPLGHPGDGEYEIYDVLNASISGAFRNEGLDIGIRVNTSRGKYVCYFAKEESEEKYQALNVTAQFLVPKDKLKEFFGFNDSNGKYFWDRFDTNVHNP